MTEVRAKNSLHTGSGLCEMEASESIEEFLIFDYDADEGCGKEQQTPSPENSVSKVIDFDSDAFLSFIKKLPDQSVRESVAKTIHKQHPELHDEFQKEAGVSSDAADVPLWAERKTHYPGQKLHPAEWIRMHYGSVSKGKKWEPDGLTQADIKRSDPKLYNAYIAQVRRRPEDNLKLPMTPKPRISDPEQHLENRRAKRRDAYRLTGR